MTRACCIGDLAKGAAAQAAVPVRRFTGAVDAGASTALRCSPDRAAAELASLTAFAALRQPRRVRGGSALRAQPGQTALLGAPESRHPRPTASTTTPFAAAVVAGERSPGGRGLKSAIELSGRMPGLAATRIPHAYEDGGAREIGTGSPIGVRVNFEAGPRLERSERSERSEWCGAIPSRAPQRSRRAASTDPLAPVTRSAPLARRAPPHVATREFMENSQ